MFFSSTVCFFIFFIFGFCGWRTFSNMIDQVGVVVFQSKQVFCHLLFLWGKIYVFLLQFLCVAGFALRRSLSKSNAELPL